MLRSILSNWTGYLVAGLAYVILTPILIGSLGDFHYGLWVLVFSVVSYYNLLDFGMHTAILRFIAKTSGTEDSEGSDRIIDTSLVIAASIAVVVLLLTSLLVWLLPGFFQLTGDSQILFRQVLWLLGITVATEFVSRILGDCLCGFHRFDLYNAVKIVTVLVRAVLMLFAIWQGQGLVGLAWATLAATLFSVPLYWVLLRRLAPSLSLRGLRASFRCAVDLLRFGFFSFVSTVGNVGRFYLDSLVIGRFLAIELITPFSIAAKMIEYMRWLLTGVMSPLITSFSRLAAQSHGQPHSQAQLQNLLLRSTRYTSLLSLFLGSLLVVNGQTLIRLWVGERFLVSYHLLLVLTLGYVVMLAQTPANCLFYALNKHRAMALWTIVEGITNLGLSIYLVSRLGLVGVAWGTTAPMLVVGLVVLPAYLLRLIGLSLASYVRQAFVRPVLVAAIFLCLCALTPVQQELFGFLELGLCVVAETVLFGLLTFWVGLAQEDRRLLRAQIREFGFAVRVIEEG